MTRFSRGWFLFCGLGLAVGACSGGDDGANAGVTGVGPEVTQACGAYAESFCGRVQRCSPESLDMYGDDANNCRAAVAAGCELEHALPDVGLTPQATRDCAAAIDTGACDEFQFEACDDPVGQRQSGQACADDLQCASLSCAPEPGEMCGTCRDASLGAGDDCANTGPACEPGLFCWAGSCRELIPIGGTCTDQDLCEGLHPCINGVCTLAASGGEPCTAGDYCAPFFVCEAGTCQRSELLEPKPGSACGYDAAASCGFGYYCAGEGTTGTCQPQAMEGQPCGPYILSTDGCLPPFECTGGTCQRPELASCG